VFFQAPLIYFALNQPPGQFMGFALLMASGCLLGYSYYSGVYATIQDLTPPSLRGTAMALYFCFMYLIGGSFGPVITGGLSDHFARVAMAASGATTMTEPLRAVGLHRGMYIIPICALAVTFVLFMASRTAAADIHDLHLWMAQPAEKPTFAPEPSS
jgi:MFS family permease